MPNYFSTDPGAPTVTATASGPLEALRCLVSGIDDGAGNTKPGAGWTELYYDATTHKLVLQPPSGVGVVSFSLNNTDRLYFWAAESATDANTLIGAGSASSIYAGALQSSNNWFISAHGDEFIWWVGDGSYPMFTYGRGGIAGNASSYVSGDQYATYALGYNALASNLEYAIGEDHGAGYGHILRDQQGGNAGATGATLASPGRLRGAVMSTTEITGNQAYASELPNGDIPCSPVFLVNQHDGAPRALMPGLLVPSLSPGALTAGDVLAVNGVDFTAVQTTNYTAATTCVVLVNLSTDWSA